MRISCPLLLVHRLSQQPRLEKLAGNPSLARPQSAVTPLPSRHPALKGLVFKPPLHRLSRAWLMLTFHQSCHQYGRDLFRHSVAITTTSDRSTAKKRRLTLSSNASNPDNPNADGSCSTSLSPVVVGFTVQRDSIEPH